MNSCLSVTPYVSSQILPESFVYSEIHHSNGDVETDKSGGTRFSRKILFCPKMSKKCLKWSFLSFLKILSLLFAGSNLK